MRIAIGCDHAGFELKQVLVRYLKELGHEIIDVGTHSCEPVDYPDYTEDACKRIVEGEAQRAVVICGSGIGASITANKIPGIRAGICHDTYSAHQGVEHDDMNVLVIGGRIIGVELAKEIVRTFLDATFSNQERHTRRLNKVKAIERKYMKKCRNS
ncbi:MAG: ribose 5-phosphate isomerase B [bacterium]